MDNFIVKNKVYKEETIISFMKKKISLENYSKTHVELEEALKYWR